MIEISHLNKIYKSKKRKKCHALKDIHLTLPDNGLVFVLGKSGSGKSTLLNLIGGLDNITKGKITVDGNDLSKFRERAFCNYRNTHIGFIFQDYHLIDELTVYDNIALSLNLRRIKDKEAVSKALERVDLAGYEDRYPTELSGGEQQRVAIARAIVKKPRIILADEPTGNLDTNTATAIVTLLKELSKDCLILIVSHNINDANNYADRIIELRKGEIISDKSRNPEFLDEMSLLDGKLVYPQGLALSDEDIAFINTNLTKFVKKTDKFIPTSALAKEAKKVKIENKGLSLWKELHLSGKFLKNKAFTIAVSAFMVAVIMIIMSLAQTIITFDGSHIIAEEMAKSKQTSLLMAKDLDDETRALLSTQYSVTVGEKDVQAFYDAGYGGKIYPVYSYTLPITTFGSSWGLGDGHFKGAYMTEPFGTMIVDNNFLSSKFGSIKYAAKADSFHKCGVVITDYVADSILLLNSKYLGKTYEDLLGSYYYPVFTYPRGSINAIIDTGYKDRYKDLFDLIGSGNTLSPQELYENEDFQKFSGEVYDRLGYCYTTNPDFLSDLASSRYAIYPPHYKLVFNDVLEYTTRSYPYVSLSGGGANVPSDAKVMARDWMYTTQCPNIPKGAKYIRVVFNEGVDDVDGATHPVATAKSATLKFSDGTSVSYKTLTAIHGGGSYIDPIDGSIVQLNRGIGYSQLSDYILIPNGAKITAFSSIALEGYAFCAFYDADKNFISAVTAPRGEVLPPKSIRMNMSKYNEIFGTDYTAETVDKFIPHKVKLTHYDYNDVDNSDPLFTAEVTIVGLGDSTMSRTMDVSKDIYELFQKDGIRVYSLYFDGTEGAGTLFDMADELNYQHQSYAMEGIHTMTKVVDTFVPIFELVVLFLCAGVIFVLVNFSSKMIGDKMHEIGILKALGTKNGTIGVVFGLQVFLIAILTCILTTAGYYFLIDLANDVLIESLHQFAKKWVVLDLKFLTFKPEIAAINCVLTMALALLSLVFPMAKIKAIKPVKIIKAKE